MGREAPGATQNPSAGAPPEAGAGGGAASRNVLSVSMPALALLQTGAEFDVVLRVRFAEALYQGCGRVAYDSAVLKPVTVTRGTAIPAGDVFVAKLDAGQLAGGATSGQDAVVPFAFTGLNGAGCVAKASGELLRIRFRLIAASSAQYPLRLLNDPSFLQLREPSGQRLSFDLSEEVGQ